MKHTVFLVLIALAIQHPLTEPCYAQLTHEEGSEVTFDSNNERYWYYDITRFSNMTYDDQIAEIAALSVTGFTGTWHMATYEEMSALWEHSAEALFSNFALTMDDDQVEQCTPLADMTRVQRMVPIILPMLNERQSRHMRNPC